MDYLEVEYGKNVPLIFNVVGAGNGASILILRDNGELLTELADGGTY